MRKFGEKSKDKQTVFVVMHRHEKDIEEVGVSAVFNELEDAERWVYEDTNFAEDYEYIISQHDIDKFREFNVGDWVVNISNGYIKLIENEREANFLNNDYIKRHELRHATPEEIAEEKERRWWAKHGRNLWELRKGDLLIDKHFGKIAEVREVEDNHYLIGKFTSYEPSDFVKRNYTVVCFAEQRLDREGE